jgi:hypothetical protein
VEVLAAIEEETEVLLWVEGSPFGSLGDLTRTPPSTQIRKNLRKGLEGERRRGEDREGGKEG